MKINKIFHRLSLSIIIGSLLLATACEQASKENIQGLLNALEGSEMVVKLDDGSISRISVKDKSSLQKAEQLVGQQVDASVRITNKDRQLGTVEKRAIGEDQSINGTIESINGTYARINGLNFIITATTELDGGLVPGANARVEFIKLADGTLLATHIETDKELIRGRGKIESITEDKVVIDGRVFRIDDTTRRRGELEVGDDVHIEFFDDNITRHANELEPQLEDACVMGTIEAMTASSITVNGRNFVINASTMLDNGLAVGSRAQLYFVATVDGQFVAIKVETDANEVEVENETEQDAITVGTIEALTPNSITIGGRTFQINAATMLDSGLAVGVKARIEFITMANGSMVAVEIENDENEVEIELEVEIEHGIEVENEIHKGGEGRGR